MTNRNRTDLLLLTGFCAFLFFYGLAQFGLIGADEPRYAQVAREMLSRHDFITPMLGGQPWLEKPPLYYWQAMLSYSLFGVSDWAARLPGALDATFLVAAMYFFLRRFLPGFEIDGALMTASCAAIIGYARAASTDMPLASALGVALLAWWSWQETQKNFFLAMFYTFIALGMLAKGPIAPFLAFSVITFYAATIRNWHLLRKTLWIPGMLLFFVIALPWYFAVQWRNPQFFREFIVEHNLARFSTNLYHHPEPFWYYLLIMAVGLLPWATFVIAAFVDKIQRFWAKRKLLSLAATGEENQLGTFAMCWLIVPVIFFSLSKSKLPGYILPAIPAGALLLADYLSRLLKEKNSRRIPTWLAIVHSIVASATIVPSLLIAYLVTQHRLPGGRPMLVALAIAFVLCSGMALTLVRKDGLRMMRFVTLIPVVLSVGATLKLGSTAIDQTLSARPVAQEIAAIEMHSLPLAVYHVRRELEYGLTFYRNHLTFNYDWGRVPAEEHLLVAPENSQLEVAKLVPGRRVSYLGHYDAQHLDYFWIAAAPAKAGSP